MWSTCPQTKGQREVWKVQTRCSWSVCCARSLSDSGTIVESAKAAGRACVVFGPRGTQSTRVARVVAAEVVGLELARPLRGAEPAASRWSLLRHCLDSQARACGSPLPVTSQALNSVLNSSATPELEWILLCATEPWLTVYSSNFQYAVL